MGRIKGKDILLKINNDITAFAVGCDVDMRVGELEVNNEVNGTALDFDPDTEDWIINCDYLFTQATYAQMFVLKRQIFPVEWQDRFFDGFSYSAQGFITRLQLKGRLKDMARYSMSIRIKGNVTQSAWNLIDGDDTAENRIDDLGNNLTT